MARFDCKPMAGAHHCVGTAFLVVDIVFNHLLNRCAARSGNLTEIEILGAKNDLLNGFANLPGLFERINSKCMAASGVVAAMRFRQEKILSSLLALCSDDAANTAFPVQTGFLADVWLEIFYDGLSSFIQERDASNPELRLNRAYANAAGRYKQELSVERIVSEPAVGRILIDVVLTIGSLVPNEESIAELVRKINKYISFNVWKIGGDTSEVTDDQMKTFLIAFPGAMSRSLNRDVSFSSA